MKLKMRIDNYQEAVGRIRKFEEATNDKTTFRSTPCIGAPMFFLVEVEDSTPDRRKERFFLAMLDRLDIPYARHYDMVQTLNKFFGTPQPA